MSSVADRLLAAATGLRSALAPMRFGEPVAHVYAPLDYAWSPYEAYVRRYGATRKRVVLLGMNPGPFGMMQTGVPFGEVAAVRDWLAIGGDVRPPLAQHAKRPILGFGCPRSEVSGQRLWGWARQRFGPPERFFTDFFVVNWCPLVFLEASGRNRTPDALPVAEFGPMAAACDAHLAEVVEVLQPQWAIGVGAFAAKRLQTALAPALAAGSTMRIGAVLHPSPASPIANRGWGEQAERQLRALGVPLPEPLSIGPDSG